MQMRGFNVSVAGVGSMRAHFHLRKAICGFNWETGASA